MTLYNIVRFYRDFPERNRVIDVGLTLEEAQAHCKDPETSSRSAKSAEAKLHTQRNGDWFDGYTEAK